MKNSLRIHKWTHNEFNIFILGVLTHPHLIMLLINIKILQNRTENIMDFEHPTFRGEFRRGFSLPKPRRVV